MIKVVDIFAGPGGLSEGFSSIRDGRNRPLFEVTLSVEKDAQAHATLLLRKFFRQFPAGAPAEYYRVLRGEISADELFAAHPHEAERAATCSWHTALGPEGEDPAEVRRRIKQSLGDDTCWVLIGGPPCQAYSLAGRSRNRGNPNYDPAKDERQRLYIEYLQILAEHRPAVFVMENVKGLLSATLQNERMFERILEDLRDPATALKRDGRNSRHVRRGRYRIHSLVEDHVFENGSLNGAVIEAERYGIPQARHRVILLGIRDDLGSIKPGVLSEKPTVSVREVIGSLPKLRSGISPKTLDSASAWRSMLRDQVGSRWANDGARRADSDELSSFIRSKLSRIASPRADRGAEFIRCKPTTGYAPQWFCDSRIGGVCNHSSRSHMESDLFRYFYAACYAAHHHRTPTLRHFPKELLPNHGNVREAIGNGHFADRFRVQVSSRPSTTIVSHISKDGHYYIHPDPLQCRSLTVREAARLQTFPDNYFFCGNRTSQYAQIGNAVPPLLAKQIGEIVRDVLKAAGANP